MGIAGSALARFLRNETNGNGVEQNDEKTITKVTKQRSSNRKYRNKDEGIVVGSRRCW